MMAAEKKETTKVHFTQSAQYLMDGAGLDRVLSALAALNLDLTVRFIDSEGKRGFTMNTSSWAVVNGQVWIKQDVNSPYPLTIRILDIGNIFQPITVHTAAGSVEVTCAEHKTTPHLWFEEE